MTKTNTRFRSTSLITLAVFFGFLSGTPDVFAQGSDRDTANNAAPAHRFIFGGGLGIGIYSALGEDNAAFKPTPFSEITLGYRLNEHFLVSAGLFGTGEKKVTFTRYSETVAYTGTTLTFPVLIQFTSDRRGVTPVFALGGYYQTDRFFKNNYTIVSGDQIQIGNFISNYGSVLKLGLAYNDYGFPDFLPFKGGKYEITYNAFPDLSDSNFKLHQSFVVFGVSLLF